MKRPGIHVPWPEFEQAILWLETAVEYGIQHQYDDGQPTPNAKMVNDLVSRLRKLKAAARTETASEAAAK